MGSDFYYIIRIYSQRQLVKGLNYQFHHNRQIFLLSNVYLNVRAMIVNEIGKLLQDDPPTYGQRPRKPPPFDKQTTILDKQTTIQLVLS